VAVDVRARDGGSGCLRRPTEHAVAGPARFVPKLIADAGLLARNAETLRRLRFLAEGGA